MPSLSMLLKRLAAAAIVFEMVFMPIASSAYTPSWEGKSVDDVMKAVDTDITNIVDFYIDPTIVEADGGTPAGVFPNLTTWLANEFAGAAEDASQKAKDRYARYQEQSPGDVAGVTKGRATAAWYGVCLYVSEVLNGADIPYQTFDTILKEKNGQELLEALTALEQRPDVKGKGPMLEDIRLAKEYALLLENQKAGSGTGYLMEGAFKDFMKDVYSLAIGRPEIRTGSDGSDVFLTSKFAENDSRGRCAFESDKACASNADCTRKASNGTKDGCNLPGLHVGHPCMLVLGNITYTNYTFVNKGYVPGFAQRYYPKEFPDSTYQALRGSVENYPCMYNTLCQPGYIVKWMGMPVGSADEQAVFRSIGQIVDRFYAYRTELTQKIQEIKSGGGKAAADADASARTAAKIGSALSLPLPLSDISPTSLVARIISSILGIIGSLALLIFVYGGITWMTARGDSKKVSQGKAAVVWAALGIVAIFSAYAVLSLVTSTLTG